MFMEPVVVDNHINPFQVPSRKGGCGKLKSNATALELPCSAVMPASTRHACAPATVGEQPVGSLVNYITVQKVQDGHIVEAHITCFSIT